MTLDIVDLRSIASGRENEDRAGVEPPLAWVIDGATDVLLEPLTHAPTDAAWFAAAMHDTVRGMAATPLPSLVDLPQIVANHLAPSFAAQAKRPPTGPEEHPSASAIVIRRIQAGDLEFVSLGDCTLIIEKDGRFTQIGVDEEDAGDQWVVDALKGNSKDPASQPKPMTRADLLPYLRAQRGRMNTPSGYGIFSITASPRSLIRHGTLPISDGARILLASDGLMRLVDVFRCYDTKRLFDAAWSDGLAPLFDELRALEAEDSDCTRFPRAKTSDDTTALLLRAGATA
jgi:hypothetical protein